MKRHSPDPCPDCGATVSRTAIRCRKCSVTNPEANAKRAASISRHARDNPAAIRVRAKKAAASRIANPESLEQLRRTMREQIQPKSYTAEAMARRDMYDRARKALHTKFPWCPAEYLDEYRKLTNSQKLSAAEAKDIIQAQIKADRARMSPFERQERALANGAALVRNVDVRRAG